MDFGSLYECTVTKRFAEVNRERLVQDAVAPASHAAFEDPFLFARAVDRGARRAPDRSVAGTLVGVTADRTRCGACDGTTGGAFRGTPGDDDFLRIRLAR